MRASTLAALGIALAAISFPAVTFAEQVVVARVSIETVSDVEMGYALGPARSVRISNFVREAMTGPATSDEIAPDGAITGAVEEEAAAVNEQGFAAAPIPAPRPETEQEVVTVAVAPAAKPAKATTGRRQVTTVSETAEARAKRAAKLRLPMPIFLGAYR